MTVLSASGILFQWFSDFDSFCPEEDAVKLDGGQDFRDFAAIQSSLADMCSHEVLSLSVVGEKHYYVLKKPLNAYDQTLEIDLLTSNLVASTLNNLCGRLDGFAENADPQELKVKDIRNLAGIVSALIPDEEGEGDDNIIL